MKNICLAFAASVLLLSACNQQKDTLSISEYNEQAVTVFNQIANQVARSREQLYYNLQSYDALQLMLADLKTSIDSAIVKTESLKYPEEAAAMHENIMALFHYEKDSIVPLYEETLQYPVDGHKWFGVWDVVETRNRTVTAMIERMTASQKEMAAKMKEQKK